MARVIERILGHDPVWQQLQNLFELKQLAHALAFSGAPGIGKRQMAWAFGQMLLCEGDAAPCGQCGPCLRAEKQQSEAIFFVEPVNGTIKLEAATHILEFLSLQRLGRARIVIVDQAQTLNAQTANALLKVIEEPPPETYFVLVTSEISQLLPTLRSRLQNVRFAPLTSQTLEEILKESRPPWMLESARGSLERLNQFGDEDTLELRPLAMSLLKDAAQGQRQSLDQALSEVKERDTVLRFVRLLQQLLRDWSVLSAGTLIHGDLKEAMSALPAVDPARRVKLWRQAFQLEIDFAAHVDRGLLFENFYYRAKQAMS